MALNNENAVAQQIHSLLRQSGDVRWQPRLVNNGGQHPCCFDPEWPAFRDQWSVDFSRLFGTLPWQHGGSESEVGILYLSMPPYGP